MKWIRWQGLIAFIIIVGGLSAFFLLLIDGLVKRAIEKTGTLIVRAKVELNNANVTLFPLGITLTRLQVTNPNAPMTNAVEAERISFSMDLGQMLRHRSIIEEMTIDRMQFRTDRETSGAISRRAKTPPGPLKKKITETIQLPSLEIPNIRQILDQEELGTLALVEQIREEIKTGREDWEKQIDELPKKDKLREYRKRIQKIKKSGKGGLEGILGGVSGAVKLRSDIKKDLDRIKDARKALKKDLKALDGRVKEAKKAPRKDINRLREKYSLSTEGLSNFTRLLLGQQIGEWTETLLRWYETARPYLDRFAKKDEGGPEVIKPVRGKGVDVRFQEDHPLPDFLIRLANLSIDIPAGTFSGKVKNITSEQHILGSPLIFEVNGEDLKDFDVASFNGELNRVSPSAPHDSFHLNLKGYNLKNLALSKSKQFPVQLRQGVTDLKGQASIKGAAIEASVSADLRKVRLETTLPKDAKPIPKTMASTLADVKGFNLKGGLSGTREAYDLSLTSDLDRVLKNAVGKQVREQAARFERRLSRAVNEKVNKQLDDLESKLSGMNFLDDELRSRLKIGDDLLKELAKAGEKGLKLPF